MTLLSVPNIFASSKKAKLLFYNALSVVQLASALCAPRSQRGRHVGDVRDVTCLSIVMNTRTGALYCGQKSGEEPSNLVPLLAERTA